MKVFMVLLMFILVACSAPVAAVETMTPTITSVKATKMTATSTATIEATHLPRATTIPTETETLTPSPTQTLVITATPYNDGKLNCPGSVALMYHHIYQQPADKNNYANVSSDKESFEKVLSFLVENGYYFPTPEELSADFRNKVCSHKYAIITIDDSWNDPESMGLLNVLMKYGGGEKFGTPNLWFGVITQKLVKYKNDKGKMIDPWVHILEMMNSGLVFPVSHSQTHPAELVNPKILHDPANDSVYAKVASEVYPSKQDFIKQINVDPLFFIYPGGNVSRFVIDRVKRSGYAGAFTVSPGGLDRAFPYSLPRINAGYGCDGLVENNANCVIEKIKLYSQTK
jgi:hypothetical protein